MHLITDQLELTQELLKFCTGRLNQRTLLAVAGAPASGKSTLAQALAQQLNSALNANENRSSQGAGPALVLPMDGFHLDNEILEQRGDRPRKGAPHTFDAKGFQQLLQRIVNTEEQAIAPSFDRDLDLSRNAAIVVEPWHTIIVVEGNYLLLDEPVWRDISAIFHKSVFVSVPEKTLRERLLARWARYGLSPSDAQKRAETNDIPNAILVNSRSLNADIVFEPVH